MVKCNQLCEWNRYKLGCAKPLHVACPLETALGNTGVANENPVTNGDHVRTMCDGALAELFAAKVMDQVALLSIREGLQPIRGIRLKAMKELYARTFFCWLQSPAEEEK